MKLRTFLGGLLLALTTYAHASSLAVLPRQLVVDSDGDPRSGAKLYTYASGTTTPLTSYTTPAVSVAHANPVISASTGLFPAVYFPDNVTSYKLVIKDSADVTIYTEDNIPANSSSASELDVLSFGVVADDSASAVRIANCTALQDLVDASEAGPEGRVVFPNLSGTTTYYFAPCAIEMRDRISFDLNGSGLNFSGSYDADMDMYGFLNCIRDCAIENGSLVVSYDGSAGSNNGDVIRLGSRAFSPFGDDADGIEDEDESVPMGNIALRNLRVTSNNSGSHAILMLGGLDGVVVENVYIDGSGEVVSGILYEFGFWHYEATAANIESSHATNLQFRNITIEGIDTTEGEAVSFTGAMDGKISGLWVDGAYNCFVGRAGEALFYNLGDRNDDTKAHYVLENINCKNITGNGLSLVGAELATGGYLAATIAALDPEPEAKAQTDQISFAVNGCSIEAAGAGISASGAFTLDNCQLFGAAVSGQIIITDEAVRFDINNSRILNSGDAGIRAGFGAAVWSPVRPKSGQVRNSLIAGNATNGISIANANGVLIENVRFGYVEALDDLTETTQDAGINAASTTYNLTCRGCYGAGLASGAMYTNATSNFWKNAKLENVVGEDSLSGQWLVDGNGVDDDIGDANTTLAVGEDLPTQRYATALTANRTVTCSETTAHRGARFEVIRTGLGAFSLDICGLKTIPNSTAAAVIVVYEDDADDGDGDWRLASYAPL